MGRLHAPNLARCVDGARPVAVADPDTKAAGKIAGTA